MDDLLSEHIRSKKMIANFREDRVGIDLAVKYNLVENCLWANDYPHYEGS